MDINEMEEMVMRLELGNRRDENAHILRKILKHLIDKELEREEMVTKVKSILDKGF